MLSEVRRHVGDEVDHPAAEAPLVVVPADDLGALRAEHQGQRGVDDRRVRVALEVGGHQLLVADGQDALQLAARGLVERRVDVLHRRGLAELDAEVDHRDVEDGHAKRQANELARDVGMMLSAAARARRRSLCGRSCSRWSAVYAWIVVMNPLSMPNESRSTLASGTKQFVVQLALEMTLCFLGS